MRKRLDCSNQCVEPSQQSLQGCCCCHLNMVACTRGCCVCSAGLGPALNLLHKLTVVAGQPNRMHKLAVDGARG